jgi:hypothetical protein
MSKCSYCGRENDGAAIACVECRTPLTEGTTQSAPGARRSRVTCPKCGAPDSYTQAIELRSSFNVGVFLLGGIWAIIFRNAGRPRRVRCSQCEEVFSIRTPASKVSLAVFWLLVAPGVLGIAILLVAFAWTLFHG